ncbi:MAG: dihydrofolate reductase [Xanthomonadales bacterium]|nr:dihydrofolate reductase [Xanthomonadales bacterium]MCC6562351.1 dihydrofolate reductase [Xanthomonadales bacterium]
MSIIAALDRNRAIGFQNRLPWSLPDDLRRFKALTMGHTILMGRKTAESIGRALPGRKNLVLTRSGRVPYADMIAVATLQEAREQAQQRLFVIGGGEVYALALPLAAYMHLTHVDVALTEADAWFPPIDADGWLRVGAETHAADARHPYSFEFVEYRRSDPQ